VDPIRALAHVHGHLGWLAAAILLHPAVIVTRARGVPRLLTPALATGIVTAQAALGAWLYPTYRERVRARLFQTEPHVGWLFERKEHLAFGLVVVAWIGLAILLIARSKREAGERQKLVRTAGLAYVVAAGLAVTVALLGTVVAIHAPL
jgi:hypothetical protein